ncbi:hypothetical protein ACBZ91_18500 [Vibrio natriegens]|uniref:hypothetical protein n=1 Tax=Vibrio natriegens TaxID=691 RepID=UPI003558DB44
MKYRNKLTLVMSLPLLIQSVSPLANEFNYSQHQLRFSHLNTVQNRARLKEKYNSLSSEQKQQLRHQILNKANDLSETDRARLKQAFQDRHTTATQREALLQWVENLSLEQKIVLRQKIITAVQAKIRALSPEERQELFTKLNNAPNEDAQFYLLGGLLGGLGDIVGGIVGGLGGLIGGLGHLLSDIANILGLTINELLNGIGDGLGNLGDSLGDNVLGGLVGGLGSLVNDINDILLYKDRWYMPLLLTSPNGANCRSTTTEGSGWSSGITQTCVTQSSQTAFYTPKPEAAEYMINNQGVGIEMQCSEDMGWRPVSIDGEQYCYNKQLVSDGAVRAEVTFQEHVFRQEKVKSKTSISKII